MFRWIGLFCLIIVLLPVGVLAQTIQCDADNLMLDIGDQRLSITVRSGAATSLVGRINQTAAPADLQSGPDGRNATLTWRGNDGVRNDIVAFFVPNQCTYDGTTGDYRAFVSLPDGRISQSCCRQRTRDADVAATAQSPQTTTVTGRINGSADRRVNVRGAPTTAEQNVVGQTVGGQSFSLIDQTENAIGEIWYNVDFGDELSGWVRSDLATLDAMEVTAVEPQPTASAPRDRGWAADIDELIPAIDGCLRVTSAKPAQIEYVIMRRTDLADVRLRDASQRQWRCLIDMEGGTPIRYDPLILAPRSRDEPKFVRAPASPQSGACNHIEPVLNRSGSIRLGWLVFDQCD
jgi:hypothetical protein